MPDPLSAKQTAVLESLLAGATFTAAAQAVKLSERTVRRWMHDQGFRAEYQRQSTEASWRTCQRLKRTTEAAAERLETEMGAAEPSAQRIVAANHVLNHALKYADWHDLRAEVAELRAEVAALKAARTGGAA